MPPIVALALVAVAIWAFRNAALHLQGKLRESRNERIAEREKQLAPKQMSPSQRRMTAARHDTGWWLSEALHGFPVARHGWQAGWLAHQAAMEQHRAIRDEHRGIRDTFRAARAQGQANLNLIEKADVQAASDDKPPLTRAQMKERLKADSPPAQPQPEQDEGAVEAAKAAHPASQPAPQEPAAAGAEDPAVAGPPQATAADNPAPDTPVPAVPAQGEPVPTGPVTAETTYSQDIARCDKIIAACDVEAVRLRLQQAQLWVEQMVSAGLDPDNTSRASDLADQIEAQIKQNQITHDHAVALKNGIQQHSAGHDYHSGMRDGGASREYLRD